MGHQLFLMPLFLRTAYAGRTQYLLIIHYHKKIILIICFAVHNYY